MIVVESDHLDLQAHQGAMVLQDLQDLVETQEGGVHRAHLDLLALLEVLVLQDLKEKKVNLFTHRVVEFAEILEL